MRIGGYTFLDFFSGVEIEDATLFVLRQRGVTPQTVEGGWHASSLEGLRQTHP